MMSVPHVTPIPRFRILLAQIAKFSGTGPGGDHLTRNDISNFKERMGDFFLKNHDVGSESVNYFSLITDVFCGGSADLLSPNKINRHQYELLNFSLLIFRNLTDCSATFSRHVVHNDSLMKIILNVVKRFYEQLIKGTLSDDYVQLLVSSTRVVYNVVRRSESNNVMRVRELGFIEAVKPLLKSDRVDIRGHAMLILIFAASEDDAKKCCCDQHLMNFLMIKLKEALRSKDHKSDGYGDIELMEAIQKLAVIDANKKTLAKLDCLELMKKVLEDFDDDEVVSLALGIMAQLAFNQDNAKWINKEMQKLLDSKFLKSSQPHLREAASNLKWFAQEVAEPQRASGDRPQNAGLGRSEAARSTSEKHIMVSYNHSSKDFVKKLVETLESARLGKVWVDWNEIREFWLDEMASGVENAWVVIVCVSLKYKDSVNCRKEAMYAEKCGVPIVPLKVEKWKPDGWLGMMITPLTYYDFSKEESNEKLRGDLLKFLREKREKLLGSQPAPQGAASNQTKQSPPTINVDFSKWNTADVQIWCNRNGIPSDKCETLDGQQLLTLKEMNQNAQDVFYRQLQQLNLDVKETSAFKVALNALQK